MLHYGIIAECFHYDSRSTKIRIFLYFVISEKVYELVIFMTCKIQWQHIKHKQTK